MSAVSIGPCNDMIADAEGVAWVGNVGYDYFNGAPASNGWLVRVAPDGTVSKGPEDLNFPNGIRFSADGSHAYLAESFGHRLLSFRRGADGQLSDRRVFAELPGVVADGIALDGEVAVWVADAATNRVLRVLEGGEITDVVHTGALRAFAWELGGPDGRDLFICMAPTTGVGNLDLRQGRIGLARVRVAA